jgi:beta-RFAP synthase
MIEVSTPARLHLGLLDTNGGLGRLFGSIGIAIKEPIVRLQAWPADDLWIEGLEADRVAAYARRFMTHYALEGGARLELLAAIPAHVGLGSGTQLALAVGAALARLHGQQPSLTELALVMGRGVHSGIGINTFAQGGFILDGGQRMDRNRSAAPAVPPTLVRCPVPDDWRFIITIPEVEKGLSGEQETKAFRQLPKAPAGRVAKMCRLLVMKMLPALIEADSTTFGQALTEIQRLVGASFAPVQGGDFADPLADRLIRFMLQQGAAGAGQSSWGPAVYGLVAGSAAARRLEDEVRQFLAGAGRGQVFCVQPDNHGARIIETR